MEGNPTTSSLPITTIGRVSRKDPGSLRQGGRPVAHIVEKNIGLRAKDAPEDAAGGLARQTYIWRGARCIPSSAFWLEWGLYKAKYATMLTSFTAPVRGRVCLYRPVYSSLRLRNTGLSPPELPNVFPFAPTERILDFRRRRSRTTAPLIPDWRHIPPQKPCGAFGASVIRRLRGFPPGECIFGGIAPCRPIRCAPPG